MDGVLFTIPDWLDYADFNNYPSEENPTTNADFIDYANNQNILLGALVAAVLWQPNTNFIAGKIIISPNMPEGMEAVALTSGTTGTVEPAWESGTEEYQDSGVKWKLRYKHWSESVEEIADLTTGATNRLPNKAYAVGNVVYTDSNLSVALKCTTAGTTSNTELDISGRAVGESVEDGSVVWKVIARSNVLDEGGVVPIASGGTGATTAADALTNLGVDGAYINASISGKTITLTKANGNKTTLTTQDTTGYHTGNATSIGGASATNPAVVVSSYKSGTDWYRVYSDGWVEQGGEFTFTATENTITMHKAMKDTNYNAQVTQRCNHSSTWNNNVWVKRKSSASAFVVRGEVNTSASNGFFWYVCGQGA